MEATTIDQLFPDVLEEIFSHLTVSDLKNFALVCKNWDDAIGSSAVAMKNLKIGFSLDCDHISIERGYPYRKGIIMQGTEESYRKHQNVEIRIYDGSLTQLPSLDRFNISQVKALTLNFMPWMCPLKLNQLLELLSRMPLLQVLTICTRINFTLDTLNAPVAHFPKLKHLNAMIFIGQPINEILDFLKTDKITELTYRNYAGHSDAVFDDLADFIKSKKSLTKLNVASNLFVKLHRRHDLSGMSLESLNVEYGQRAAKFDIVVENIRKSLIANAHSLTSLSIPSWLISREVLVAIFNRLRKLTTLEISSHYDDDDSWMDNLSLNELSPNLSLKTLKVPQVGAIDGLRTILQSAPQLKNLSLGHVTDDIMNEVATSAPKLVELEIGDLETLTCAQRFNELKSLKIKAINNVDSVASLLERCPKNEAFECTFFNKDTNNLVDILLQQKTLKHLRFNLCYTTDIRIIFDKLKSNYGNLRSLKLGRLDDKIIFFDFPENPAEWDVEEQEARLSLGSLEQ